MKSIFSLLLVSVLLMGCVKNNPDPSWIEIAAWDLQVNPDTDITTNNNPGVLTSSITDAWVYMDGELVGVFELPVKLPVLSEGSHKFNIYPAIVNNGISATKKIYPFLEPFEVNVNLVKNEITSIAPNTRYYSSVQFWIEDFEDPSIEIAPGSNTLATLVRTSSSPVFDASINEGSYGRISLDATNYYWIGSTIANNNGQLNMNLPRGKEVYLEIDYHNTNEITTGVLAINNDGSVDDNTNIRLNGQNAGEVKWKKIYIDLREVVSGSTNANYFEFSFQSFLEEGKSSGEVNIDNIKAVYF